MIEIRKLYKRFSTNKVLQGLDLSIEQGETLVILGPSGVGKSVLLKHIIGISEPDRGSVIVDGVNISELQGPDLFKAINRNVSDTPTFDEKRERFARRPPGGWMAAVATFLGQGVLVTQMGEDQAICPFSWETRT